ncbi:MAG: PEGA domain-containing protein [Candidatus Zixiibacteriota bacterium]|nr:MAG: PEGA domain-containing protein [candidate division Zixibacteria bacterium]
MLAKRTLVVLFVAAVSFLAVSQAIAAGFSVSSNPAGAEVVLKGYITVAGITPVSFQQGLEGRYKVRIEKYGYETYRSHIYLDPQKPMSLSINLRPKTRFKALARSVLIPGWGQAYTDQRFKAGSFLFLAAAAVGSYLIVDSDFDDKNDRYRGLLREYNELTTYAERQALYPGLAEAKKDAYDAENVRRITIGAVVAVWGLNALDLLFFFPEMGGDLSVGSLSIVPDVEDGGARVMLTHRF